MGGEGVSWGQRGVRKKDEKEISRGHNSLTYTDTDTQAHTDRQDVLPWLA